jgi:AcrR family transcriptional regulator
MVPGPAAVPVRRGRGARAGIDRARIAETARSLDPRSLTVQAVADELGVDRKAIDYHVSDREGLLRLAAQATFQSHFAAFTLDPASDWREAAASWASAIRDSLVATGTLADYFRLARGADDPLLGSIDALLRILLDAGFPEMTALRGLIFLATFAVGSARDVVIHRAEGGHPQIAEVGRALAEAPGDAFPTLRSIDEDGDLGYEPEQFDFGLRIFIQGMEQELDRGRQRRRSANLTPPSVRLP